MNIPRGPIPRASITDIEAYIPGKSTASGGQTIYKLSSNETPLGASPHAIEAYRLAANRLELYPDGTALSLREAIGSVYDIDPECILCGAGSDEILALLAQAYLEPGDEAIHSEHGFLVYPIVTRAAGGVPIVAGEENFTANVDAILEKVGPRTKIIFLANPNNPTGTYLPAKDIQRLHAGLPDHVLLVLDAAYGEYVYREDYESGIELVSNAYNVVMTRTFSKIYGLASLRLGWCYAPQTIIDILNRIRGPFNVNRPAMTAGIAAVKDQTFIQKAVAHNDKWLPLLTRDIQALGIDVTQSVGNFIMLTFPERAFPKNHTHMAADADSFLLQNGIILRRIDKYGLPNSLRMTIGNIEANEKTVEALSNFMKGNH